MVRKLCPWRHMAFYSEGKTTKSANQEEFAPRIEGEVRYVARGHPDDGDGRGR